MVIRCTTACLCDKNQPMSTRARSAYSAILSNSGRNSEALKQIQQLQALKQGDPYTALFGLQVTQKANVRIDGLVQRAIKLVASGPITTDVIQSLLELSTRRNNPNHLSFELKYHITLFENAINNPSKLINASAEGFLYGQLGEMLLESGRTSDAVMTYSKAVRLFPESTRMALMYIDMLIEDGQLSLARKKLESIRPKIPKQNKRARSRIVELDSRLADKASLDVKASEL